MKTYCVKYRIDTDNIEPKMVRTDYRLIMQPKCSISGIEKSRFMKGQDANGLLINLGIKAPFRKTPLLNILF